MKRACIVHDIINLFLLPFIGALTVAGLTGHVDPALVTWTFLAYIVGDFVWVLIQPEAVPSLPSVILLHHAVTAVLLCIPLKHPHLHYYTCVDGLVELNTFFLIARRQWRSGRRVFSWLYWSTFVPMRMVLYPIMLPVFFKEMREVEGAPWLDTLLCVGCQLILCGFNVVLLALSVMNWRKRRGRHAAAGDAKGTLAAGAAAPAAAAISLSSKDATCTVQRDTQVSVGGGGVSKRRGGSSGTGANVAAEPALIAAGKPGIDHAAVALKARTA